MFFNEQTLPVEAMLHIHANLTPEDLRATSLLSASTFRVTGYNNKENDDSYKPGLLNHFWKNKLKRHFPHLHNQLKFFKHIDWYAEFLTAYKKEYKDLHESAKRWFSVIKDEDISTLNKLQRLKALGKQEALSREEYAELKKLTRELHGLQKIERGEFTRLKDKNDKNLTSWLREQKNQKLRDCVYDIFADSIADLNLRLKFALDCQQPLQTIYQLAENPIDINAGLLHAARTGHFEALQFFLRKGAELTTTDGDPIINFSISGNLELFIYLDKLSAENNIELDYLDLLLKATHRGHREILAYLLDNNYVIIELLPETDQSSLAKRAIRSGSLPTLKYLADKGLPLHAELINLAEKNGHLNMIQYLLNENKIDCATVFENSNFQNLHAFHYLVNHFQPEKDALNNLLPKAIANAQNLDVVSFLFSRGQVTLEDYSIPITRKISLLNFAAKEGNIPLIEKLNKMQLNLTTPLADLNIRQYQTPTKGVLLYTAIENDHLDVMDYLLKNKVIFDKSETGSLLHCAAKHGRLAIIKTLLARQHDINDSGNKDQFPSPLCAAIQHKHAATAKFFIENGARINTISPSPQISRPSELCLYASPLFLAIDNSMHETVALLLTHGADIHQTISFHPTSNEMPSGEFTALQYAEELAKQRIERGQTINADLTIIISLLKNAVMGNELQQQADMLTPKP